MMKINGTNTSRTKMTVNVYTL